MTALENIGKLADELSTAVKAACAEAKPEEKVSILDQVKAAAAEKKAAREKAEAETKEAAVVPAATVEEARAAISLRIKSAQASQATQAASATPLLDLLQV